MVPVRMVILDSTSRVISVIGNAGGLWARGQANARESLDIESLASVVGCGKEKRYSCARGLESKGSQSYAVRVPPRLALGSETIIRIDLRHEEQFNKYLLVRSGWSGGRD